MGSTIQSYKKPWNHPWVIEPPSGLRRGLQGAYSCLIRLVRENDTLAAAVDDGRGFSHPTILRARVNTHNAEYLELIEHDDGIAKIGFDVRYWGENDRACGSYLMMDLPRYDDQDLMGEAHKKRRAREVRTLARILRESERKLTSDSFGQDTLNQLRTHLLLCEILIANDSGLRVG